ncbi:thioredoxin domain-containing protein [Arthrobacter sp. PAMC25564]|uniref:thioredoxin domain-containing protein n=1 Tax=Arthrobacter sp. PAMC25564 TaxID=2565366 RepID=UPI0010A24980|nr:thioredoxin domain-containing protein [Arthrobacter sp. PAMC25564]QCB98468.1 thioredoxin domain-containing protein [Arthrobacter sp. PAMC25564]
MPGPEPADGGPSRTFPEAANALGGEPSAYLRQHAGNPVHWRPFGDEAFAFAAARDVPVFLSIGYAACHWCHVMAHESFEDPATAEFLNANFVAIKVDREERPDVDAVYMAATQAISGEGGWPMSVFLLPDGRAFHAGTYYPPRPMPGRPSFGQVLEAVREAWRERRGAVEANAATLARGIAGSQLGSAVRLDGPPGPVDAALLPEAVRALARSEDPEDGGFGAAPKFPPSAVLEFLIRHAAVPSAAAGPDTAAAARDMAGRTLAAMSRSALFDQLDGGFARYSVTRDWSVPHFEKMLYDNAQLLRVYVHWVRLGGTAHFPAAEAAEVASRTADWILSSLGLGAAGGAGPEGGPEALASSLDADTVVEGVHSEGASYLWTAAELAGLLGPADGPAVAELMNVHARGTVSADGSPLHPGRAAGGGEAALWQRARPLLLAARNRRPQPARDDKVVAGWNGLAVAALAEAGAVLGRPELAGAAERIAAYLARVHWKAGSGGGPGTLVRVSHAGAARGIGGLLEDYAFCAEGLLALYAVSGRTRWYRLADAMVQAACTRFVADGALTDTAGESEQVFNAQGRRAALDPFDGATPSGAAAFAGVLLSYSALSGSSQHRALAGNILSLLPPLATRAPRVAGWLLATAQAGLAGPVEAAVAGPDTPERAAMHRELLRSPSPGLVIAVQDGGDAGGEDAAAVPLLHGRGAGPDGGPQVFLCRGMVCDRPAGSVEGLRERLAAMSR